MRASWVVLAFGALAGCEGGSSRSGMADATSAVAAAPGTTTWSKRVGGLGEELAFAVAAGADGTTAFLTAVGPPSDQLIWRFGEPSHPDALGLVRLDEKGAAIWSSLREAHGASIWRASVALSPLGNTFVALHSECAGGCLDLGGGPLHGSALVKLGPTGRFVWQRSLAGTLQSGVAVDANGGTAVAVRDAAGNERLVRHRWDGVKLWEVPAPALKGPSVAGDFLTALAFDSGGNLLVGRGLEFFKLDGAGRLQWSANLAKNADASGFILDIGATALGTVVVSAGFEGEVTWAATDAGMHMGTGLFMAVAEANGAPRVGSFLPYGEWLVDAAVDPAGRLALLTRVGYCGDTVQEFDLTGTLLWERRIPDTCPGSFGATAVAVTPASGRLGVTGWMEGTVNLGAGPVTSRGEMDAFVVELAP